MSEETFKVASIVYSSKSTYSLGLPFGQFVIECPSPLERADAENVLQLMELVAKHIKRTYLSSEAER
jgi:hypothetical protein